MSKHKILISVGSNIDKQENTRKGLDALNQCFGELKISTIYESESVGFSGNNFFNLVVLAYTDLDIENTCLCLKNIEDDNGRIRDKKFGNRTLDLDLLTYDKIVCEKPIKLPRPEIEYNAFVLKPMAELVPTEIHPTTNKSYQALWNAYMNKKQKLWPSQMTWRAE